MSIRTVLDDRSIYSHVAALLAALWWITHAVLLSITDVRTHRLPLRLIATMSAGTLLLLAGAAPVRLLPAVLCGLVLAGVLFLLALPRRGVGLGDAALAFPIGVALGWTGWSTVPVWALAAGLLMSLTALTLLALRRVEWRSTLPLGPFLLAAVLPALLL
ncbi:prepilin peptidase [Hamadaea sp. NPDC051192]|uniref:prepilin peptidase n=1 Tax=Hamadaea sp. NPDC051192 TaxID=3154940 RepID=UPI003445535A